MDVAYDNDTNVQRLAVERVGPQDVLVIDARGEHGAASFGHIIATRIAMRGAAGLVTDGALRDTPAFRDLDLPAYCVGAHATTSSVVHYPVDMRVPIGCGGVLVMPRDVVIGDAEGVVVVPKGVAESAIRDAAEQDDLEEFVLGRIRGGAALPGVYPPNEEVLAEYQRRRDSAGDPT
jgi:regulator of RNase E activity RraA